jgi:hypothetical protein
MRASGRSAFDGVTCIKEQNEPLIQGIAYLCEYKSGDARSENHSEFEWVTESQLKATYLVRMEF